MIFLVIFVAAVVVAIVVPIQWQSWHTGWRGRLLMPPARQLARPVRALVRRLPGRLRLRRRRAEPDPFEALRVQIRLSAVAEEIRVLNHDEAAFARAARLKARADAYDALLREACELAGVDDLEESPSGSTMRMRRELELAQRGWSW